MGTVWKLEISGFKLMVYKINMHLLLGVCTRVYMHIFPSFFFTHLFNKHILPLLCVRSELSIFIFEGVLWERHTLM